MQEEWRMAQAHAMLPGPPLPRQPLACPHFSTCCLSPSPKCLPLGAHNCSQPPRSTLQNALHPAKHPPKHPAQAENQHSERLP